MKKISLFDVGTVLFGILIAISSCGIIKRNKDKIKATADQVVDNVLAKLPPSATRTSENKAIEEA